MKKTDLELLILLKIYIEDYYINGDREIYSLCSTTSNMLYAYIISDDERCRLDNCLRSYKKGNAYGYWWPPHRLDVRYDFVCGCVKKEGKIEAFD